MKAWFLWMEQYPRLSGLYIAHPRVSSLARVWKYRAAEGTQSATRAFNNAVYPMSRIASLSSSFSSGRKTTSSMLQFHFTPMALKFTYMDVTNEIRGSKESIACNLSATTKEAFVKFHGSEYTPEKLNLLFLWKLCK